MVGRWGMASVGGDELRLPSVRRTDGHEAPLRVDDVSQGARRTRWRAVLEVSTTVVWFLTLSSGLATAQSVGGKGGDGNVPSTGAGGAGGGFATKGTDGANGGSFYPGGGGGGGAGAAGGAGGTNSGYAGGTGGAAGTSGSITTPGATAGQSGSSGFFDGGGGGGGGNGILITGGGTFTVGNAAGGDGGAGGAAANSFGAGGGGGSGGYGIATTGGAVTLTTTGTVTGGTGGKGGNGGGSYGGGASGDGGSGGGGVYLGTANSTLNAISGTITGGTGGSGGTSVQAFYSAGTGGNGGAGIEAAGSATISIGAGVTVSGGKGAASVTANGQTAAAGAGGAGIYGGNLTITNAGTISGGLANNGAGAQADAITFTGGTNSLTLSNGGTTGTLNGGIGITGSLTIDPGTAAGSNVTLANTIHDVTTAGTLTKAGAGTLTLTGTNTYTGGTTFGAGILNVGSAGALGTTGTLSFTGGRLQYSSANQTDYSSRFSTAANQAYSIDTNGQAVTFASALTSSGGSLTKLGAGTLTLTGANTYTGATTISGGTLALSGTGAIAQSSGVALATGSTFMISGLTNGGASIKTLSGNGTVTLGASTLTITAGSTTFAGGIGGTGGLTLTGGTQTLSGVNNYTGATTITAGTLAGGAANTFSAASATSIATGGTLDLGGFAQTINAVALTGGTLRNGALTGAVTSTGGVIDTLGGSASLTTTAGTTTLAGANTYTGATNITAGTLVGAAANVFSATSATGIATGGTLDLGGFAQTINAVALTGGTLRNGALTGAVTSTGGTIDGLGGAASVTTTAGTTIAIGTSTYTGGTTITGGTLQLGNGGTTGSITGAVTDNGTLAFARSDTSTFANVVSGTGNVQQNGTGTTILTAANTYTGATTINAGTLQIDGSIASPNVVVNSGGTLSGVGTIGDPIINAGGTLSPGNAANPTGTLTIVGPLTFSAGSYYNVNITPTANSRTNVVGTTTIVGGTVQVLAGSGTYATNTRYTILTSTGGVAGTFTRTTANTNFAFLTPTLSYDANDVYVTVLPSTPIVTTNPTTGAQTTVPDYRTAAGTQNQRAVAGGLTQAGILNGGTGRVLTALNQLTVPQARAAFDALSGEGITAAQNVANRSAELFTSSIFDQTTFYGSAPSANSVTLFDPAPIRELADLPSDKVQPTMPVVPNRTWRAWATGFGGVDNIHGNGQIGSSYQQNTIYGGTLGVDYQLTSNYLVGVAIGGTNGDFLVPGRATSGSTTGGHVAFYDLATFGSFYGASSTSFSYFGNRATRTVSGFGGLGTETERDNFNSDEFRTRLEFGRHLAGYGGVLTPFVALELAQLRSNGFTESSVQGAGLFRLNVSGQSQASAPAFVGLRLQRATSLGNGITLSPTLQVAYVHEFAPYRSQIGTLADLPGSTFLIDGARPARNAAQVKAGAEMAIGARSLIFANFDGEFSGVNQLYAGKGGFRYVW